MFKDRKDAGRQLAVRLSDYEKKVCIIYGLPRGGIPLAYEIASYLKKPLEALIVKKIGVPGQEELALGAIAEGEPPSVYINESLVTDLGLSMDSIKNLIERKKEEITEIQKMYRNSTSLLTNRGAIAIVVDDGVATGATMKAAVKLLRGIGQKKIIVAVPVGQISVLRELGSISDEIVCLEPVKFLYAVGEFYDDFSQTEHREVVKLLKEMKKQLV